MSALVPRLRLIRPLTTGINVTLSNNGGVRMGSGLKKDDMRLGSGFDKANS
ncbi:hypothetical protein K438DRAFT_1985853 [Mycena galopus ATCC 62051]|nr:hypothetical protein K438DRAFT_1985853 [Mycena galopus ATCC 62051]